MFLLFLFFGLELTWWCYEARGRDKGLKWNNLSYKQILAQFQQEERLSQEPSSWQAAFASQSILYRSEMGALQRWGVGQPLLLANRLGLGQTRPPGAGRVQCLPCLLDGVSSWDLTWGTFTSGPPWLFVSQLLLYCFWWFLKRTEKLYICLFESLFFILLLCSFHEALFYFSPYPPPRRLLFLLLPFSFKCRRGWRGDGTEKQYLYPS